MCVWVCGWPLYMQVHISVCMLMSTCVNNLVKIHLVVSVVWAIVLIFILCIYDLTYAFVYLKKPLQPSHVMALKWKPVALSPHTPQIRGMFLSNSSGAREDVLTTVGSITVQTNGNEERNTGEREKYYWISSEEKPELGIPTSNIFLTVNYNLFSAALHKVSESKSY